MTDLEGPLKTHIPGNIVGIAPFYFTHEVGIDSITATFENQDVDNEMIVLRGRRRKEGADRLSQDGKLIKHSGTHLWTKVPGNAVPGMYKCGMVIAHTYGGKSIPFDDPDDEIDWTFWVLAETETPPKFGLW